MALNNAVKYWAFISYSHRDTGIADWLHEKLERYHVPRSLVGVPSRDGIVPERLIPIFRDREELPTSSELGDNLQRSLEQSRYLVVICSPAAAQSRWVEEEIRAFKKGKGRNRIIALIANGVPNASDRDDTTAECFPHSLRFEDDGPASTPNRVEPVAADLRPNGDGRERAFLKIVAGLLGVGFDDLYQRERRRQQRRRIASVAAAIACLLVAAATFWSIARLGKSQKEIRQDMTSVRNDAAVATTEFKDVQPRNKEAEDRIRAAAQRAAQALDVLAEARQANKPDKDYTGAFKDARSAVAEIDQEAKTTEESIFAAELAKPLRARLTTEGAAWSKEMIRRVEAKTEAVRARLKPDQPK